MYNVLIIDDDGLDVFMHTKIVKVFGFSKTVVSVKSAQRGLAYLNENSNEPAELPDIIFLDLTMPMMDGLSFLDAYDMLPGHITGHCHIVVLTGMESEKKIAQVLRNKHVLDVVPKPLNAQVLKIIDSKISMLRQAFR